MLTAVSAAAPRARVRGALLRQHAMGVRLHSAPRVGAVGVGPRQTGVPPPLPSHPPAKPWGFLTSALARRVAMTGRQQQQQPQPQPQQQQQPGFSPNNWLPQGLWHMATALTEVYGRLEGLHPRDILLSLVVLLRTTQQRQQLQAHQLAADARSAAAAAVTAADAAAAAGATAAAATPAPVPDGGLAAAAAAESALFGADPVEEDAAAATRVTVVLAPAEPPSGGSGDGAAVTPIMVLPPATAPFTDPAAIADALRLIKWAAAAYASDDAELERLLPVGAAVSAHVPQRTFASNPRTLLPAYLVGIDHSLRAVVVAIRGTWAWADAVVNLTLAWEPWAGGTAHRGMLLTAKATMDGLALSADLPRILEAHPGYRLVTCGHSMGGGVAALCASMLQLAHPGTSCHVFAAPSCVSKDVAAAMAPYVTSWVNGDDIVGRFHVDSSERLRRRLSRLALADELAALLAMDGVVAGGPRAAAIARALAAASSSLAAGASALGGWSAALLRDAPLAALARLGLADSTALRKLVGLAVVAQPGPGGGGAAQGGDAGAGGEAAAGAAAEGAPPPPPPAQPPAAPSSEEEVTSVLRYLYRLLGRDGSSTATTPGGGQGDAAGGSAVYVPAASAGGAPAGGGQPSKAALLAAAVVGSVPLPPRPPAHAGAAPRMQLDAPVPGPSGITDSFILLPESGDIAPPGSGGDAGGDDGGGGAPQQARNGAAACDSNNRDCSDTNNMDSSSRSRSSSGSASNMDTTGDLDSNSSGGNVRRAGAPAPAAALPSPPPSFAAGGITGTYVLTPLRQLASLVPWSAAQVPAVWAGAGARPPAAPRRAGAEEPATGVDELAAAIFLADEVGGVCVHTPPRREEGGAAAAAASAASAAVAPPGGGEEWVRGLQFYPPGRLLHLSYPSGYPRAERYSMMPPQREAEVDAVLRRAAGGARRGGGDDDGDGGSGGAAGVPHAWLLRGYAGPVLLSLPPERPTRLPAPPPAAADAPPGGPGIIPEALMDTTRWFSHMHITPHAFSDHLIAALEAELCGYARHLAARLQQQQQQPLRQQGEASDGGRK